MLFTIVDLFPKKGQVIQYETSSCIMGNNYKYKEYHERYLKIDGSRTDKFLLKDGVNSPKGLALIGGQGYEVPTLGKHKILGAQRKRYLDRAYGSFNSVKDDKLGMLEKTQENVLKTVLPKLVTSLSFNEQIISASNSGQVSQVKQSTIRLSLKRAPEDNKEEDKYCKYLAPYHFDFIRSSQNKPMCKDHYVHFPMTSLYSPYYL